MIYPSHHPKMIVLGALALLAGGGLLVWHFMADPLIEKLATTNPFLAETISTETSLASSEDTFGLPRPGYYTDLYLKEFGLAEEDRGSLPANAENLRSFIKKHRLTILPPPVLINAAPDQEGLTAYRGALSMLGSTWRPVNLEGVVSTLQQPMTTQSNEQLRQLSQQLDVALNKLGTLTVPPAAARLHRYHMAAVLFSRNAILQLAEVGRDPAGAVLAADMLDQLPTVFRVFAEHNLTAAVIVPPDYGKTVALSALVGGLGYGSESTAAVIQNQVVAGVRDPAPAECSFCLPLDDLLMRGGRGI